MSNAKVWFPLSQFVTPCRRSVVFPSHCSVLRSSLSVREARKGAKALCTWCVSMEFLCAVCRVSHLSPFLRQGILTEFAFQGPVLEEANSGHSALLRALATNARSPRPCLHCIVALSCFSTGQLLRFVHRPPPSPLLSVTSCRRECYFEVSP